MVFGRLFYVKIKQKRISNTTESNETKGDINIISANIDIENDNNIGDSETGCINFKNVELSISKTNVNNEDDIDSYGMYIYNNHKFMPCFANILIRNTSLNF